MRKENEKLNDMIESIYIDTPKINNFTQTEEESYENRLHNFFKTFRELSDEKKTKLTMLYIQSEVPPEDQYEVCYEYDGFMDMWCNYQRKEISSEKFLEVMTDKIVHHYRNDLEKYMMNEFDRLDQEYMDRSDPEDDIYEERMTLMPPFNLLENQYLDSIGGAR